MNRELCSGSVGGAAPHLPRTFQNALPAEPPGLGHSEQGLHWAHRGPGHQAPLKCQGSPESRRVGARRSAPRWPRSILPGSGGGVWGGVGTAWVWAGAVSTREPHAGLRSHPVAPAQVHASRLAQRVGGREPQGRWRGPNLRLLAPEATDVGRLCSGPEPRAGGRGECGGGAPLLGPQEENRAPCPFRALFSH